MIFRTVFQPFNKLWLFSTSDAGGDDDDVFEDIIAPQAEPQAWPQAEPQAEAPFKYHSFNISHNNKLINDKLYCVYIALNYIALHHIEN